MTSKDATKIPALKICRKSFKTSVFSFAKSFGSNYLRTNYSFADHQGVTPDLSLHPVHLTPDKEGSLPPSALIPFCSYQGDSSLIGHKLHELGNVTTCDKFEPTILEGQRCYSLDVGRLKRKPSRPGKKNGLFLLLDSTPYHLNDAQKGNKEEEYSIKVFVHSLAQYSTFGPGSYGMSALKKMTGTESFEKLPDHQKKCLVHNREECQTQKYLEQVERECECIPWVLGSGQKKIQVNNIIC